MASLIELVGNTPMAELRKLNPNPNVKIFAKLEGNNPGGSVKDRTALNMITEAMKRGDVKPGDKMIEATSGNTGIALAMIACLYDLQLELVLPDTSTKERTQTMEAFGANVTLLNGIEACRDYAETKAANGEAFILNQFANDDNWGAHYKTTGPEIWRGTNGQITHFVSAMGTTGTIMGCSKFLKEQNNKIQIIGCQPTAEASIPGIRRWPEAYLPKIFDPQRVDRIIDISEQDAIQTTKNLARQEGVFAGMSSGGAAFAAIKLAAEIESGTIVFIACDRGDRYLSSNLFA